MSTPVLDQDLLYKAYSASYTKERNRAAIVQFVDLGFIVAGGVMVFRDWNWPQLAAAALLWLAIREAPWFLRPDKHRRVAVRIQEQFDCFLGIPTNEVLTGEPVPQHEVRALADGSTAKLEPGYFPDTGGLHPSISAIIIQYQTATWGEVDHGRYANLNYVVAFLAILALMAWAYLSDRGMQQAVSQIFGPAAPFVVGRLQLGRRHEAQSEARREIRRRAETALKAVTPDTVTHPTRAMTRSLQDRLYHERLNEGRIPKWLYRLGAAKGRRTIDAACQAEVRRLRGIFES